MGGSLEEGEKDESGQSQPERSQCRWESAYPSEIGSGCLDSVFKDVSANSRVLKLGWEASNWWESGAREARESTRESLARPVLPTLLLAAPLPPPPTGLSLGDRAGGSSAEARPRGAWAGK